MSSKDSARGRRAMVMLLCMASARPGAAGCAASAAAPSSLGSAPGRPSTASDVVPAPRRAAGSR